MGLIAKKSFIDFDNGIDNIIGVNFGVKDYLRNVPRSLLENISRLTLTLLTIISNT